MGRTSLEKEIARNRNITVRLTETEYDIVRNDAASAGLSISNYCRKQILKGAVPVQYSIKASIRDENGHRLCDMLYDVRSDHVSVIFKHGPEKYTISFE